MGKTSDAVFEGVSIASAAARLAVRNHILMETIAHDAQFDADAVAGYARDTLIALADEQEAAADLARRQRKTAWGKFSDPDSTHDYRDRDTRNLRKRDKQYRGVAQELRNRAADPEAVSELVEQARDAAWGDVESNLQRRLQVEGMRADNDPEYDTMRGARMQALRLVDLPRLAAHRRRLVEGESLQSAELERE
ncbi:asparagine synthase [Microbacterium sp. zg.B48]|uniref:asparagine synthase n=1 Tax=unclassified Microbacterium TaxID=2609290 RepID=UPI00214AD597|nr:MULTISPECIES: asparagine synthase [unclassified Microbacterium]MCR2764435.1 asparagine synthase [Microbacterium sp. zg.B48]MCR2810962.1 asparagine synthase [Microbacterium sp. zg.B185]WIM19639.1 asparagine synthase [Microbacterium sp. zg-B185]